MAKQELSAKDFRDDLLRVLADKTGLKANLSVSHNDVYDGVANLKGVTRDQYGHQGGTKIQWVDRWIQWAFKALVEEGLGKRSGRGKWALTTKGVTVAGEILQTGDTAQTSDVSTVADDATSVDVTSPPAVSLMVGPGQSEDSYHTDPYIRALAAQDTTCFSSFSDKSDRCNKCLLAGSCMNAMAAELSSLASELTEEDKQEEARKRMGISDPKPKQDSAAAPASGGKRTKAKGQANLITIQQQALCKHCGKTIPKGEDGYWVRSSGEADGGLYHQGCLEVE